MALNLQQGVYTAALSLVGAGALAMWPEQSLIGFGFFAAAGLLLLWGIKINDHHLWQRWWQGRVPLPAPSFEMSFNQLVRRVAYESDWAANFSAETPGTQWQKTFWWKPLKKEILRALAGGDLEARGILHERHKEPNAGPTPIPASWWSRADFGAHWMLCDETIGGAVNGDLGEIYSDIEIRSREVDTVWPARSNKATKRRPSPFVAWHREWWDNEELARLNNQMAAQDAFLRAQRERETDDGGQPA